MRVLVAHQRYRAAQPSGENTSVDLLAEQLRVDGHDVRTCMPESDSLVGASQIRKGLVAANAVSGRGSSNTLRWLRSEKPDIVQLHNWVPELQPRRLAKATSIMGIPLVHVVHNFRHTCIAGTHFRAGSACYDCLTRSSWQGVRHGCYRGSQLQSGVMALARWRTEPVFRDDAAAIVCISEFIRQSLIAAGYRESRLHVIPNACRGGPHPSTSASRDVLFAGRLEPEKGVLELLQAWRAATGRRSASLHIAGAGSVERLVRSEVAADPSIRLHGKLDQEQMRALMASVGMIAVPSLWHEPLGRTVLEAYAAGRPVLATNLGGLPELVVNEQTGLLVDPTVAGLTEGLEWFFRHDEPQALGHRARRIWERQYAPHVQAQAYVRVYEQLIQN
jgi:glycosyltransferase involved in cell wall biosynthesis